MSRRRTHWAVASFALTVLWPVVAFGQTITAELTKVVRSKEDATYRQNYQPNSINYRDCVEDAKYSFQVSINNPTNLHLQVWASLSEDCTDKTKRTDRDSSCGEVLDTSTPTTGQLQLSMRNIVVALKEHPKSPVNASTPSCSICAQHAESSATPEDFTLYFMLSDSSSTVPDTETIAKWPADTNRTNEGKLDLAGPLPPDTFKVGRGEALPVSWKYVNATQTKDILSYRFFCDPPVGTSSALPAVTCGAAGSAAGGSSGTAGSSATGGAAPGGAGGGGGVSAGGSAGATPTATGGVTGVAGSGGSSGSSSGDTACPSSVLVQGKLPDPTYECGSVLGSINSETNLSKLSNGTGYAVAMAAVDNVGNVGVLSKVECGTPQLVTDFFETYRAAGGKGGGGFCSFSPSRASRFGGVGALSMALIVLLARRKRRA